MSVVLLVWRVRGGGCLVCGNVMVRACLRTCVHVCMGTGMGAGVGVGV